MNKNRLIIIVGIVVASLVLVGNIVISRGRSSARSETAPALPEITSETQPMTVDEIHMRFRKTFDVSMPGAYVLEVDKDAGTITLDFWTEGFNADVLNMSLKKAEYLRKWNEDTANLVSLCDDMQAQVTNHGHPEVAVVCRFVNCDDTGQIFAVATRGQLTYDVVADTPPGEEIPDPTKRVVGSATDSVLGTYVVNTYSRVFHDPSCSYADQIAPSNRAVFTGDRLDLIAQGCRPCNWCSP